MVVPSGLWPEAGAPVNDGVGSAFSTVKLKVVVALRPPESVAVIVTVVESRGPSAGVYDQFHLPVVASLITAPTEAVRVTVFAPSGSAKVPALVAGEPSMTAMEARKLATVGASLTLVTL